MKTPPALQRGKLYLDDSYRKGFLALKCSYSVKTRKRLYVALLAVAALTVLSSAGEALYRFDDLLLPSGKGAQWMVVTTAMDTGGSPTSMPIQTEGNLVEQRSSIRMKNGGVEGKDIHTMFLVLPETNGSMSVGFDIPHQTVEPGDILPPDPAYTQDVEADLRPYYDIIKTPLTESLGTYKLFGLEFIKKSNASAPYESIMGYFIFHQNPGVDPSQTLNVPFVVANVKNGTAEHNPLLFKATTRDTSLGTSSTSAGNIAAYDRFTWDVLNDKPDAGGGDWIFVPITNQQIDKNTVNYRLTTEVTNYTSLRYALQRYDGYGWGLMYPSRWAFDLPSERELPSNIYLDELSHIPPGLVTTYSQSYNVVSGVKDVLKIYPVDAPEQQAPRTLTLAHRSIFGLDFGTGKDSASPASYSATGFKLLPAGADFLKKVGEKMGVSNVTMPEMSDGVMNGAINYAPIASDVVCSMAIEATVPSRMRGSGLLPLHITFNLPRANQIVNPKWDTLLREWRNTGNIKNRFAESFSVYLRNAQGENFDLVEWLYNVGIYDKTFKVFLDEQRGVITVSFIVLMMDGAIPRVEYVEDSTPTTRNTYITIMDGNHSNKWDLTFFVAPSKYVETDHRNPGKGDGGDGCNIAFEVFLFLACVPLIFKRR